jgi:hypothetical protein
MGNWKALLAKKCIPLKIQPVVYEIKGDIEKIVFFCAIEPKGEDKADLIQTLPMDCKCDFTVSPKPTTVNALRLFVSSAGGTLGVLDKNGLRIYLPEECAVRPVEEIVQDINEVLAIDEYYKAWTISVGETEYKHTLAQAQVALRFNVQTEKHDFRDKAIGVEDVMDLRIMLETMDVDKFLESI